MSCPCGCTTLRHARCTLCVLRDRDVQTHTHTHNRSAMIQMAKKKRKKNTFKRHFLDRSRMSGKLTGWTGWSGIADTGGGWSRRWIVVVIIDVAIVVIIVASAIRIRRDTTVLLSSASDAIQSHSLFEHAHADAFLETARLTSLPPALIDLAVVGSRAVVFNVPCKRRQKITKKKI